MRSVYRSVMSDVMAAHHLIPLLERLPGVRTSDLARGRGVSMSTVSRQVDQLVQQGWVRVEPDPEDQRAHRLHLTDEATSRLATARANIAVLCERRLGSERAARLIDAANALREAVDALADLADEPTCPLHTAEPPRSVTRRSDLPAPGTPSQTPAPGTPAPGTPELRTREPGTREAGRSEPVTETSGDAAAQPQLTA
jgi:DNA-binding MarR family transcriptional regulator